MFWIILLRALNALKLMAFTLFADKFISFPRKFIFRLHCCDTSPKLPIAVLKFKSCADPQDFLRESDFDFPQSNLIVPVFQSIFLRIFLRIEILPIYRRKSATAGQRGFWWWCIGSGLEAVGDLV